MSFISGLRKAFGITPEEYDPDMETPDDETPGGDSDPAPRVSAGVGETTHIPLPADDALPADILTAVVEVFNRQQPEFVQKCIDTDAQKQYLLQAIDADLRQRIESAIERAHEIGRQQYDEERRNLAGEIDSLRRQKEELEQRRDESRSQKLSAERQKRALNERVHDLELQVQNLEAEREQYMLENRSMMNKLRVAQVTGTMPEGVIPDLEEMDTLRGKLAEAEKELTGLREQMAEAETQAAAAAEEKLSMTAMIERLQSERDEAVSRLDSVNAMLQQANEELEAAEATRQMAQKFEQALDSRDAQIDELRKSVEEETRRAEVAECELGQLRRREQAQAEEIESLRDTIARNAHANAEFIAATVTADTQADFAVLPPAPVAETTPITETAEEEEKPKKRRRGRPRGSKNQKRISAIDELMDGSDWLVAPSPETMTPNDLHHSDDFGYQEPPRKPATEPDDRQLSLF